MVEYRLQNVHLDQPALSLMLQSPNGAVGRHLGLIGLRIVVMAKRLTGVNTGKLSKSVQMKQTRVAGGQQVRVFSNSKYALMVHEGTRPHVIDPAGERIMAFNVGGQRVYTQRVQHPGTRGKYFLTIPLRRIVK